MVSFALFAMKESFVILCCLLLMPTVYGQVVNIEGQRMRTDSVRLAGNFSLNLSFTENNAVSLFVTRAQASVQWKSRDLRSIWLLLGNYELSKAEDKDFSNAAFAHLRYNYKFSKWIRWELFSQIQYNRLLGVKSRLLLGTGPRIKFLHDKKKHAYAGLSYMYEYEETLESPAVINSHHRLSSYLTFSLGFPALQSDLVWTTYYQPRPDVFSDFRMMQQTSLTININKHIRFTSAFFLLYDSHPPAGIGRRAIRVDQGIRYEF